MSGPPAHTLQGGLPSGIPGLEKQALSPNRLSRLPQRIQERQVIIIAFLRSLVYTTGSRRQLTIVFIVEHFQVQSDQSIIYEQLTD